MASVPAFASTPRTAVTQISTANTNRDGTGTIGTVLTAAAAGTRIDDVKIVATGATTAGVVRLFLHDGSNSRLWTEVIVTAITPSTTVAVWSAELNDLGLVLKDDNWSLRASTHNAEAFNVCVTRAADYT
jgi:hypothetical protein